MVTDDDDDDDDVVVNYGNTTPDYNHHVGADGDVDYDEDRYDDDDDDDNVDDLYDLIKLLCHLLVLYMP